MKIAIVGAGALGLLYGGYLSQHNEVHLICHTQEQADSITAQGVIIEQNNGNQAIYQPHATADSTTCGSMDVVILLVKATANYDALTTHKSLIGESTLLVTLQNGAGHEQVMAQFAAEHQLALGVSYEGGFRESHNHVRHTSTGGSCMRMLTGDATMLQALVTSFPTCGLQAEIPVNIRQRIWDKLMINASSSVLCATLGTAQGYCYTDPTAWALVGDLVREMVAVAQAAGFDFDYAEQLLRVQNVLTTTPHGVPSICVDLRAGRKTEVETISGSVVREGLRVGVPTPTHNFMVRMVHAMEGAPKV